MGSGTKGQSRIEIQNHGIEEEARIRQLMPEVAKATGCPIIATNDCHFLDKDHHEAHDILMALQTGTTINDPKKFKVYRKSEGDPQGAESWKPMRKGVADLHRRTHHRADGPAAVQSNARLIR